MAGVSYTTAHSGRAVLTFHARFIGVRDMNFLTGGFLSGYRTYILGGLLAIQAVAQFAIGDLTLTDFISKLPEILMGLGLMTLRAGVSK